jgi:hypothetical protein
MPEAPILDDAVRKPAAAPSPPARNTNPIRLSRTRFAHPMT